MSDSEDRAWLEAELTVLEDALTGLSPPPDEAGQRARKVLRTGVLNLRGFTGEFPEQRATMELIMHEMRKAMQRMPDGDGETQARLDAIANRISPPTLRPTQPQEPAGHHNDLNADRIRRLTAELIEIINRVKREGVYASRVRAVYKRWTEGLTQLAADPGRNALAMVKHLREVVGEAEDWPAQDGKRLVDKIAELEEALQ